ncbi:MAG: outer membrane protein assembly factor BamB [Pirellulaceae bacterium]
MVKSIILLLAVAGSGSSHWCQFRGPTGDGHLGGSDSQTTVPVRWDENTNVAWKSPIDGKGLSSPVIWENRLWVTTALMDGRQLDVVCIDLDSGKPIYQRTVFDDVTPQRIHATSSHASPTPVVEAGRVYVHFGSYGTACLDAETGATLWTRSDFVVNHRHGPASSPILAGNLLILQFDGIDEQFMVALDKRTGETAWFKNRDIQYNTEQGERKKAFCTPLLIVHEGTEQLVTTAARAAIAYNAADGSELWRVRFIGDSATARPVYGDGMLFVSTSCIDAKMLAINPSGRGDITETGVDWLLDKGIPQRPSPLLIDGLLYCMHDQGILTCRDPKTGGEVWKQRLGGKFAASPIYAGGHIYIPSEDGETFVVKPGREYQLVGKNVLDEGCMASPAALNGGLLLRTANHLYRIGK